VSKCEAAIQALREFLALKPGDSFRPIFAMKRYRGTSPNELPEDVGFLAIGRGTKLYLENIFMLKDGPLAPQLEKLPIQEYPSMDAMLADGWEVD
jgi:hypothetical protein